MLPSACRGGCLVRGVSAPGGVSGPGGVCSGGVFAPGGVWSGGGGCLLQGRGGSGLKGGGCLLLGGIAACTEADPPPVNRITHACKNITLAQLRCGR